MKTLKFYALIGAFAAGIMLTGCSKDEDVKPDTPAQDSSEQLSTAEYTGLIDMYEKQKLHYDVYTVIYEKTGLGVFYKLMHEEQIVLDLLAEKFETYDERNPLRLKAPGEFLSSDAKQIYADFEMVADAGLLQVLQFAVSMEKSATTDIEAYLLVLKKEDITLVCTEMLINSTAHIDLLYNEMKSPNVVVQPLIPVADF